MSSQKRIRILQIGYSYFAKAGIQAVIMNIARGIHEEFDVDVLLTSNEPGYYDEEFERYGTIYRVNCSTKGFGKLKKLFSFAIRPFKQFFYTRKLIKANGYDIVHIHSGMEGGPMFLAAKAAGVKHIIAHSHNTASPQKRSLPSRIYRGIAKRIIHRYATVRIGVSKDANRYLYGEDESFIINNPVELEKFMNVKQERNDGEFVMVNVGRYTYQKNQGFILDILHSLVESGQQVCLKLVGFGEDEEKLRAKIEEYGLGDKAELIPGNGDVDIPSILGASDLFIFPSHFEGLGIVMIEAQAAECLCLASDVVPEETDLGLCEYLSLNQDASAWGDKIIEMKKNCDKYLLNRERLDTYRAEKIQQEFCALYRQLIS